MLLLFSLKFSLFLFLLHFIFKPFCLAIEKGLLIYKLFLQGSCDYNKNELMFFKIAEKFLASSLRWR